MAEDVALCVCVRARFLCLSLGLFTLGEVSCHVMKTFKQPCGEVHLISHWGLLPVASKEMRLPTTIREHSGETDTLAALTPSAVLAAILTTTSCKTWGQKHSQTPYSQKLCEITNVYFNLLSFELVHNAQIDKYTILFLPKELNFNKI